MTLRRAVHLLGAMAVLAFAASACDDNPAKSSPHHAMPSPSYYASGVPYVYKNKLYIDHKAQPGTWFEAETGGAYTAATNTFNQTWVQSHGITW